ncbi:MAG TPA: (2Fe-2S)-binding protein, partial [Pseudonocardiaceae bacterium]|nr:(2Fe-2S)-binding protein [Pseudonocardiaceae bacterium]
HLGLVARLVSPALEVVVRQNAVLDIDLRHTWWQPVLGGPFPLSVADNPFPGAETFASRILDGPVRTLGDAFAALSVSRRVLWGNVASALNGAASILAPARTLVTRLLAQPPLADTSTIVDGRFLRRSCCLIYQAAAPLCGDCVLRSSS